VWRGAHHGYVVALQRFALCGNDLILLPTGSAVFWQCSVLSTAGYHAQYGQRCSYFCVAPTVCRGALVVALQRFALCGNIFIPSPASSAVPSNAMFSVNCSVSCSINGAAESLWCMSWSPPCFTFWLFSLLPRVAITFFFR
jgi:hypothetical protein